MAHYLIQTAYTPEAWATMSKNPQDRGEAIRPAVEALGGRLESFYMCFGEYDVVAIADFPSNEDAAAFGISVAAGGAVRSYRTTPLFEPLESVEAMKRAGRSAYSPPG
ncbi:MAG: GYD domain-containing protein [Actinomycetes bacterium]